MRRSRCIFSAVCLLFCISFALSASARDDPPVLNVFRVKKVKFPSQLYRPLAIQDIRMLSSKKGIAILEELVADGSRRLHTLLLKKNGITKLIDTASMEETIYTLTTSLVWIDGAGAPGAAPAAKGHFLLFLGGSPADEMHSTVYMAKLNAAGKITQQPTKIFEVPCPHEKGEISLYGLGATRGPASVAVAATMSIYDGSKSKSYLEGRFFETDFEGNLLGTLRDVPFDQKIDQWGGNMRPAWSGKKWLSPIWAKAKTPGYCRCYMAVAESMVGAAPADISPIKVSLVFKGGTKDSIEGDSCFLPDVPAQETLGGIPAAAKGPNLFLNVSTEFEMYTKALSEPAYRSFIQPFKRQGRKTKQTTPLPFEAWNIAFQSDQNWMISSYREYLSEFLVNDSGDYIVARADSIGKFAPGAHPPEVRKYHGRIGLLNVDADFKKVTPILWQELLNDEYIDAFPLLRRLGDVCWILVRTKRGIEAQEYFFIATYSLK